MQTPHNQFYAQIKLGVTASFFNLIKSEGEEEGFA